VYEQLDGSWSVISKPNWWDSVDLHSQLEIFSKNVVQRVLSEVIDNSCSFQIITETGLK
jgi:hypothetical protein